jgi:hypothetical protein
MLRLLLPRVALVTASLSQTGSSITWTLHWPFQESDS